MYDCFLMYPGVPVTFAVCFALPLGCCCTRRPQEFLLCANALLAASLALTVVLILSGGSGDPGTESAFQGGIREPLDSGNVAFLLGVAIILLGVGAALALRSASHHFLDHVRDTKNCGGFSQRWVKTNQMFAFFDLIIERSWWRSLRQKIPI